MTNPFLVPKTGAKAGIRAMNLGTSMGEVTRRTNHGDTAWTLPAAEQRLRQPQDGAGSGKSRLANIASRLQSDALQEADDARLTGGTRSLKRRLLGLNIAKGARALVTEPVVTGPKTLVA